MVIASAASPRLAPLPLQVLYRAAVAAKVCSQHAELQRRQQKERAQNSRLIQREAAITSKCLRSPNRPPI